MSKANEALDKMAENARELGLDYEPAQQEPVVTARQLSLATRQWDHWKQYALELQEKLVKYEGGAPMVLNTSPQPAQRTWVGLTDEEKRQLFDREDYDGWLDYINAIEAKLRSKNEDRN